jgi:hypothetical protein
MKTEIFSVSDALRLHELGGYASLRTAEPVAAIVELGSDLPSWITFVSPVDKIWGMPFPISDLRRAKEGAVLRDAAMQRRITSMLSPSTIYSLAPLPVVDACVSDTSKSVHAELQGYHHLSAFIAQRETQGDVIQGGEAWLQDFPRESVGNMSDVALESAGWLSLRAEAKRAYYGLLLFAMPAITQGTRGASIDQVIDTRAAGGCVAGQLAVGPTLLAHAEILPWPSELDDCSPASTAEAGLDC